LRQISIIDIFVNYPAWAILGVVLLGIGGTLFFVGTIISLAYAFSDGRRWGFAVLLLPGFQYIYCFINWKKASYPGKLLLGALVFLLPVLLVVVLEENGILNFS